MAYKPGVTDEGYRSRSVDALKPYLAQIEAYVLEHAGLTFDTEAEVSIKSWTLGIGNRSSGK